MRLLSFVFGTTFVTAFVLTFSTGAFAAWGDWQWLEPDDELSITCSYPENLILRGALAGRITILAEDESNKSFSAVATIGQMYASEFKNGKEKEKFKFEAKDGWPFGRTTLPLRSGALVKFISEDAKVGHWGFTLSPPFKSGDKVKKEVKSVEFGNSLKDSQSGVIKIDKNDFSTVCNISAPVCTETGSSGAGNGYGAGEMRGCHTEGEHIAKRYRGFRAFRTDMKSNLLAEMKIYSYEYSGQRRLNMESRLRQLGFEAHGWSPEVYNRFLDQLLNATKLPENERNETMANLKERLAKALAGGI